MEPTTAGDHGRIEVADDPRDVPGTFAHRLAIDVRTDIYAVLITATGCINLYRVNQLLARRALRILTTEQKRELASKKR